MKRKNFIKAIFFIFVIIFILTNSSSDDVSLDNMENSSAEINEVNEQQLGYVSLYVDAVPGIEKMETVVSADELGSVIKYDLYKKENIYCGIIGDIPVGTERQVTVNAYSNENEIVYSGSTTVDVIGNHVVSIIIKLQPVQFTLEHNPYSPIIKAVKIFPDKISHGDKVFLEVDAFDQDSDNLLNINWSSSGEGSFEDQSNNSVYWEAPAKDGVFEITVTVTDEDQYEDQAMLKIEVDEKYGKDSIPVSVESFAFRCWYYYYAPRITCISVNPRTISAGGTAKLNVSAYDPHNLKLYYKWYTCAPGSFDNRYSKDPNFTVYNNARPGWYRIKVIVWNGYYASFGCTWIKITKNTNKPPVISSISALPDTLYAGDLTQLSLEASDPEGDTLTYQWTSNINGIFDNNNIINPSFSIDSNVSPGAYSATVTVSDGINTVSRSVIINVLSSNKPPVIEFLSAEPLQLERGDYTNLSVTASDPDGDSLSYSWSTDCPGTFDDKNQSDSVFTVGLTADYKNYNITVVVSDGKYNTTGVITISVKNLNNPPEIINMGINPDTVDKGSEVKLSVAAEDIDGDILSYSWSSNCPGIFDDNSSKTPLFTVSTDAEYGLYNVTVSVSDGKLTVQQSIQFNVAYQNLPPVILNIIASPNSLDKNETAIFSAVVVDPNGDSLTYNWSTDCPGSIITPNNESPKFTVGNEAEYKDYTVQLQVSDGLETTTASIILKVKKTNISPEIINVTANPTRIDKGEITSVKVAASDPDGDVLTYNWISSCPGEFSDPTGDSTTFTASLDAEYGECILTAFVSDGTDQVSGSITINIWNPDLNIAPEIISSFQSLDTVKPNEQVIFRIRAKDPEGSSLSFDWDATKGTFAIPVNIVNDDYTESMVIWTAPDYSIEPIAVKVVIKDNEGLSVTKEFLPIKIDGGVNPNHDPRITTKINADPKWINGKYGYSLDMDGNTAIASRKIENSMSVVDVIEFTKDNYQKVITLSASDSQKNDYYGFSSAIDNNIIVISSSSEDGGLGDPLTNCGAVYVYEKDELGDWNETAILYSSEIEERDKFGSDVAVDNGIIIIGAVYEDGGFGSAYSNAGSAYIFEKDINGKWIETAVLRASDLKSNDYFGCSVDIFGDYAVVGAEGKDIDNISNSGAVYVYKKDILGKWNEQMVLKASDYQYGDSFGCSVAINNNYIIVGSDKEDGGNGDPYTNSGAVYVYKLDKENDNWFLTSILRAPDKSANDFFGSSVSISGRYILIGARYKQFNDIEPIEKCGAVYLYFLNDNNTWNLLSSLYAPDKQENDYFGYSAAISNDYGLISAVGEDGDEGDIVNNSGALYLLEY